MTGNPLTIDFFHDVVCSWCFNISPRLRALAEEFDLDIRHRTYVLQADRDEMIARFGSMDGAKAEILRHWAASRAASDTPEAFNIEGMRAAGFEYPFGMPAALACKAAEIQGGQDAHWAMFDALQKAHISEARNVADEAVLRDVAAQVGLDAARLAADMAGAETRALVEADRAEARRLQVTRVPTMIVRETGHRFVNGPLDDLRAQLLANRRLVA